jgi:hypothetical protein
MDKDQNFDPFIDWGAITDEMVADFHPKLKAFRDANDRFLENPTKGDLAKILRYQQELSSNHEAIIRTLFTVPAMVHVAGPREHEDCEEHDHHAIQRCARCGSTLAFWRPGIMTMTEDGPHEVEEDEISWWEPGSTVAKAVHDHGGAMYLIEEGQELDAHEKMCVDLSGLGS